MPEPNVGGDMTEMTELYDQENDVYYFTFKTGEPSYCVEVNDVLVLEIVLFTQLPTGFRILNMAKQETKRVTLETVREYLDDVLRSLPTPTLADREAAVEQGLRKVLA